MRLRNWPAFLMAATVILGVLAPAKSATAQVIDGSFIADELGNEFDLVESKQAPISDPDAPRGWIKQFSGEEAFVTITAYQLPTERSAIEFTAGQMDGFGESLDTHVISEYPRRPNVVQIAGTSDGIDVAAAFFVKGRVGFLVASAGTPQPSLDEVLDVQLSHFAGELALFRPDESERVTSANNAYAAGRLAGSVVFYGLLLAGFIAFIKWAGNRNGKGKDGEKNVITFPNPPNTPPGASS